MKKFVSTLLALSMVMSSVNLSFATEQPIVNSSIKLNTDCVTTESAINITAMAATYSGECGDNATYELNTGTGEFIVHGYGDMKDYSMSNYAPWDRYRNYITTVIIEDGITKVGRNSFSHCTNLTGVTIPNTVTEIGWEAFMSCSSLTNVEIPYGVTTIGVYAFAGCSNLVNISIPESVKILNSYALSGCKSLESIYIPYGVEEIGAWCFSGCSGLTNIIIPDSVTYLGMYTFLNCSGLTSIRLSNNITKEIYGTFQECSNLTHIEIPSGITEINFYPFSGCTSLTSITIPSSVTYMLSVDRVFSNCDNLKTVYCVKGSYADNLARYPEGISLVYIDENNNNENNSNKEETVALVKEGTFKYLCGKKDYTAGYNYDENFFSQDNTLYNNKLAAMSLCLSMSAFASSEETDGDKYIYQYKNVENLLTDLQFGNFKVNDDFKEQPTTDSIGVAIASKKIENGDYTLLAVTIRGAGYESEWASNFTLGRTGEATGFGSAKNEVIRFLKEYIADKNNNIDGKIKIWITGYSRAGATANLTAGALDKGENLGSNVTFNRDDLYAYCFEPPMGAVDTSFSDNLTKYNNIFNIVNYNDVVPRVAMSEFGFGRYGIDKFFSCGLTDTEYNKALAKMLDVYTNLESYQDGAVKDYDVDNFKMDILYYDFTKKSFAVKSYNRKQGFFLDDAIRQLSDTVGTRDNYVDYYQNSFRLGFMTYYNSNFSDFWDKFVDKITQPYVWYKILKTKKYEDKKDILLDIITESASEAGIYISKSSAEEFADASLNLIISYSAKDINVAYTLIDNIGRIGQAHVPDLCYAWVNSETDYKRIRYRTVRINCPVDVVVYDENNHIVAEIVNNEEQEINDSSIVSGVNFDGEKFVVLPIEGNYRIELKATDDGTVNYSISEYNDALNATNRIVNYYDISVVEGDILNATVPSYKESEIEEITPDISSTVYTLAINGEEITPSEELVNDDAINAYYTVSAVANNDDLGIVSGSGSRQKGSFAQLEAVPYENCSFVGWYKGETLLSSDSTYRFCVNEDIDIVGKFISDNNESDVSTEGTTVSNVISHSGGGSRRNATTTTTETTTEVTTEETTENAPVSADVKVTIGSKKVVIGDKSYDMDVAPYIQANSNSTLVPLRFVVLAVSDKNVENVDASKAIAWDSITKTATINVNNKIIQFTADSDIVVIDGKSTVMENNVKAEISDDRMFIPFRALGKALGVNVDWDSDTKTATYTVAE